MRVESKSNMNQMNPAAHQLVVNNNRNVTQSSVNYYKSYMREIKLCHQNMDSLETGTIEKFLPVKNDEKVNAL